MLNACKPHISCYTLAASTGGENNHYLSKKNNMKALEYNSKHLAKKIRQLMKESERVSDHKTKNKANEETDKKQPVLLTQHVTDFLKTRYDFRYNMLTEETEFRPSGQCTVSFQRIDKRELNTFCLEAHGEGINCWNKDLQRYIYSTQIESYHPFRLYMDELPGWDGTERLESLARRVSDNPLWIKCFRIWMLGLAAQWMGTTQTQANSVAPILISEEQGRHKSTFCRTLMPPQLARYYSDNLKLTAQGNPERLLAEMGLLNMDEFDKYGPQKMPLLKNLMQMSSLNICKAYQKNFRSLPRIASFIGTSNRTDLLSDPTGSRRFICIEAEHDIDCTGIEHTQIYAQLKAELLAGTRHWFSKEEENDLQYHNLAYYRVNPIEDIVRNTYIPAASDEPDCLSLSAVIIHQELKKKFPTALRNCTPIQLAQMLTAAGISRQHTRLGNVYLVKRLKEDEG